jgi:hypothetical protein
MCAFRAHNTSLFVACPKEVDEKTHIKFGIHLITFDRNMKQLNWMFREGGNLNTFHKPHYSALPKMSLVFVCRRQHLVSS